MKNVDDPSYQLLTTQYLRKQAKQLSDQLTGIRKGDDIEYVHRARVACRRLRVVLQMSRDCVPRKQFKMWRKEIRKLLKGLGGARDKDVQAEFLWSVLAEQDDTALLPGIARIVVGVEHQREALQPSVVAAVERAEQSGVAKDMIDSSKATLDDLERRNVQLAGRELFSRLEEHISENLGEFFEHEDCLADAQNEVGHHEMRIVAKQLRYTMEICRPAYAGRLDNYVTQVKRVQSLLGDIHDCDVWVEHLAATLGEEGRRLAEHYGHGGPIGRLAVGIEHLRDERRATRARLFKDLANFWEEPRQQAFRLGLSELIGCCALRGSVPPIEDEEIDEADQPPADEDVDVPDQGPTLSPVMVTTSDWT